MSRIYSVSTYIHTFGSNPAIVAALVNNMFDGQQNDTP